MNRRGFTLIEVMVAMVVLSIALLAVMQMNIIYVKANTYNHQLSAATQLAQEKMEELRSYAHSDRADKHSPFDFDFLISEANNFTSVFDGTNLTVINGLASGAATTTTPSGAVYVHMSSTAPYTATETLNALAGATAFDIVRTWSVAPLNLYDTTRDDYAHLVVSTTWTDQYGEPREVRLESLIHRRQ